MAGNTVDLIKPFVEVIIMEWGIKNIDTTNNTFELTSKYEIKNEQYNSIGIESEYSITKEWTDNTHKSITFTINDEIPYNNIIIIVPQVTVGGFAYSDCRIKTSELHTYEIVETGHHFRSRISDYFYNKISKISNDGDFTSEDIETYGLDGNNEEINISTTSKLIKYLKAIIDINFVNIKSIVDNLSDEIEGKLDESKYIVDTVMNSNSNNPIANSLFYTKYQELVNSKANVSHNHNMSDINSLNSTLDNRLNSKTNVTDFNNHVNNKNNPHNVTLSQLGIEDTGWDFTALTQSSLKASNYPHCRKYGKMVVMDFHAKFNNNFKKNNAIFTLKSQYRPNHDYVGYGYLEGTGKCFTCIIYKDGRLVSGRDMDAGDVVRINACYFTA